jgi:PLP dependent protein
MSSITDNVKNLLVNIPNNVTLVAAAKSRTPEEILEACEAGIKFVGENYIQEAEKAFDTLGHVAQWHFIGHLQTKKVKKAVRIFDMIETIDSIWLAEEIDRRCEEANRTMEVLLEINIASEPQKAGVLPEDVAMLAEKVKVLKNIRLRGFMTMGPFLDDPEKLRPWFRKAAVIFNDLKGGEINCLSMGMSDSWRIAIDEGATMVRIGTGIFGPRPPKQGIINL